RVGSQSIVNVDYGGKSIARIDRVLEEVEYIACPACATGSVGAYDAHMVWMGCDAALYEVGPAVCALCHVHIPDGCWVIFARRTSPIVHVVNCIAAGCDPWKDRCVHGGRVHRYWTGPGLALVC